MGLISKIFGSYSAREIKRVEHQKEAVLALEEHYRARWQTIRRWIDECGEEELREDRAAISGRPVAPRRRSKLPTYADAVAAQTSRQPA